MTVVDSLNTMMAAFYVQDKEKEPDSVLSMYLSVLARQVLVNHEVLLFQNHPDVLMVLVKYWVDKVSEGLSFFHTFVE